MLDLYFAGSHPDNIAVELKRNPKSIKRRLEQLTYNERDKAVNYDPFHRLSRTGKKLTQNELLIIQAHRERNVPPEATAKILQRKVYEFVRDNEVHTLKSDLSLCVPFAGVGVDVCLAYRCLIDFFKKKDVITEAALARLEEEEREFGKLGHLLDQPRWQNGDPHPKPQRICELALYLLYKHQEMAGREEDLHGS